MVNRDNNNRALREERARIAKQMSQMVDEGLKTPDDRKRWENLDSEQRALASRIELLERADEVYQETRRTGGAPPNDGLGVMGATEREDREYKTAFGRYLRIGRGELTMEDRATLRLDKGEFRDMGTGGEAAYPGATSGFFVPVGFINKVERALKYYGPMLDDDVVSIMPTATGQPLPMPTSNDTTVKGELIGEGEQVTTADVNIGQIMFGAYKMSTKLVKVSLELLEDSAFNIEDFLTTCFAERIGRGANTYLTTGLGSANSQPMGIVTQALAGGQIVTAAGSSTNDGVGAANTIGSDDLVSLEHKVDPLYRPGAKYMMNDTTLRALKQVKDKYGRPLWQESTRDGQPSTVNGYAYSINNDMDQLQTSPTSPLVTRNTVLFGAMKKYMVRRVRALSVLRLSERFADFGQVAFLGFFRFDGNLVDAGTHPVAVLQNAF